MKLRSTLRPVTQRDLDDATLKPAVCEMGAYVGRHRHNPKSDQKPIFGRREPSALKFRFPSGFNAPTSGTLAREQALQLLRPSDFSASRLRPGFRFTSCFAGDATTTVEDEVVLEPGVPGSASFGTFEEIPLLLDEGKLSISQAPMSVAAQTMMNIQDRLRMEVPRGQAPGAPLSPLGACIDAEDDDESQDPYREYAEKVKKQAALSASAAARKAGMTTILKTEQKGSLSGTHAMNEVGSLSLGSTVGHEGGRDSGFGFRFIAVNTDDMPCASTNASFSQEDASRGGYFDCYDGHSETLSHSATRIAAKLAAKWASEEARNVEIVKPGEKYLPLEALRRDQVHIDRNGVQPLAWPEPGHSLALHMQNGNHWNLVVRSILRAVGCEIQGEHDASFLEQVIVECSLPHSNYIMNRRRWYQCHSDLDWGIVRSAALRDMEPRLPGEPVPPPPKLLCVVHLPTALAQKVANTAAGRHMTTTADLKYLWQQHASSKPALEAPISTKAPARFTKSRSDEKQRKFFNNPMLPPCWPIFIPPVSSMKSNKIETMSARRRNVSSLYSKEQVEKYMRPKVSSDSSMTDKASTFGPNIEKQLHMAAWYQSRIENFSGLTQTRPLHTTRSEVLGLNLC